MDMNIYAYKCKRCGHVQYPYRTICRKCHDNDHNEFDIVPLPKNGKLLTFTHLYNPPADFELVFLSLGIVELEDGNRGADQHQAAEDRHEGRGQGRAGAPGRVHHQLWHGVLRGVTSLTRPPAPSPVGKGQGFGRSGTRSNPAHTAGIRVSPTRSTS
jgi:hypothetical protein